MANDYAPVAQRTQPGTGQLLKVLRPEIARALPQGMDADRIERLVLTEFRKSENAKAAGIAKQSLNDCTHASIAGALLTSSALGLEPGVNGECYLIPYRDNRRRVVECQLIIGYQGIVKMVWNHPRIQGLKAEAVYANDKIIEFTKGTGGRFVYEPTFGDRGEVVAYYAEVKVKGAPEPLWDVFTPEQIKSLRRGKVGTSGDIKDPERWMERKTALKQVLKLAPKTSRLDMTLKADEATGAELVRVNAIQLPSGVDSPGDYIDGEVDAEPANESLPPVEGDDLGPDGVVMASDAQLEQISKIRVAEKYTKDADWHGFLHDAIGVTVKADRDLSADQAQQLIDMFGGQ